MRAVVCDIYGTLLEVGPPPVAAAARWTALWRNTLGPAAPPTLAGFAAAVGPLISAAHARGRARGLLQPEVDWPALAATAFPALARLTPAESAAFFLSHARLCRTTRLAEGAAACLRTFQRSQIVIGIASNAQACTRAELASAMADAGIERSVFDPGLCFFSYEHGVAKPDPKVFSHLSAALTTRGIQPAETLMVGDHLEFDVAPARAAGWHAWHLCPEPGTFSGPWTHLRAWWEDRALQSGEPPAK